MKINTYLLALDFIALPIFGFVASKIIREKVMIISSLGVVLFSIPLLSLLRDASLGEVLLVRVVFVIFGVSFFAPFHAWVQQLVPSNCRYAIISLGYALGSQVIGSPTAAFALWCFKKTQISSTILWINQLPFCIAINSIYCKISSQGIVNNTFAKFYFCVSAIRN